MAEVMVPEVVEKTAEGRKGMRTGALVLGLLGGLAGLASAVFALTFGGIGGAFDMQDAGTIAGLGWSALGFSLLGLFGAALALARPRLAGMFLVVSALGVLVSVSFFALISTPLLLVASLLAVLGRKPKA